MNWDQMRRQYYRTDGTFRDIYILEMDSLAWQNFFELMKDCKLTFHTSEDDVAAVADAIDPHLVERQWKLQEYVPVARVQLSGGLKVNFYFFEEGELEATLDPRDVKNEARHRDLWALLCKISNATQRVVKFSPENNREKVLYQVKPKPPKPAEAAPAPAEAPPVSQE